jgi:hypothetical protein
MPKSISLLRLALMVLTLSVAASPALKADATASDPSDSPQDPNDPNHQCQHHHHHHHNQDGGTGTTTPPSNTDTQ